MALSTAHPVRMSFITADKTFDEIVNTCVSELDKSLYSGLEVGTMHLFYSSRLLRDSLLRFPVQC
jgi:hypothetical protein